MRDSLSLLFRAPLNQPWILALADDLTGALETGAKFAACGLTVSVTTNASAEPVQAAVQVIDTETRHMSAADAQEVVARLAAEAATYHPDLIYKKTDSTLRGNIAAELRGLLEGFPDRQLVFAPAYPAMGRTVRDGHLLINGIPVCKTEFGSDLLNPVVESDVRKMLGDLPALVLDGETDDDVLTAARLALTSKPSAIAAGPAALAGALAVAWSGTNSVASPFPAVRHCLVVNGSMHSASKAQVEAAQSSGCFGEDWRYFDETIGCEGVNRARQTGLRVFDLCRQHYFDAIIVFGGDTAYGIHSAFGSPPFRPYGEIVPGVPVASAGGMTWITKAGGFGPPEILCEIRRRLS